MAAKGISLHIGLNAVDPAQYAGWDGPLDACEYDAQDMTAIAAELGYTSTTLLTAEATSAAVIDAISIAAGQLTKGDTFLVTNASHGGQVTDTNGDEAKRDFGEMGEQADSKDETWCLYDRQLIDDELWALWARFAPGVRILVLSDSCHSGTVTRQLPDWDVLLAQGSGRMTRNRALPRAVARRIDREQADRYAAIQKQVPPREASPVQATVVLISGCMDNQESQDGDENGLFTGTMLQVWADGRFQGTMRDLRNGIAARMPSTQTPNYYVVGKPTRSLLRRPALRL